MFDSPNATINSTNKIIIDAKRPDTHYFTLHSYREWAKRFATGLVAAGLQKGDRVMLFAGNNIFNPMVIMGTIMAGGIYNSANPAYTPRELSHPLKDSDPRFILAADNCVDRALEAVDLVGMDRKHVFLFTELPMEREEIWTTLPTGWTKQHWSTLVASPEIGRHFVWEELESLELAKETAILIYSSGTTGLPKGVELSHRNIVANALQVKQIQLSDPEIAPNDRRSLCTVPLFHVLGLGYFVFTAPKWGIQTYLMERYNLPDLLDHIQRFKITNLILVPPILVAMAKHPSLRDGTYDISSVRSVGVGGAPTGMEVTQQFEELFDGKLKVRQAWGMSEYVHCYL